MGRSGKQQQGTTITLSWFHVMLGVIMGYLLLYISVDLLEYVGVTLFPELGILAPTAGLVIAFLVVFVVSVIVLLVVARRGR